MDAIEILDVHQAYGRKRVLDGATLRVPQGTTTVLLGENGEGKTTLLRLCLGVLKPKAGTPRACVGPWASCPTSPTSTPG
jgi:ABC-type multidrug transport system ATPase subunit